MAYRRIMQALTLLLLLWPGGTQPVGAGEPAPTSRQREIVDILTTSTPPWDAPAGPWLLAQWNEHFELDPVVAMPTGTGNAGAAFKNAEECQRSEGETSSAGEKRNCGVAALLAAATMRDCRLTPEIYPQFDSLQSEHPDFAVMQLCLQALLEQAGQAAAAGRGERAETYYRAGIICGTHLLRDRSSSVVFATGLLFSIHSAAAYRDFLNRAGRGAEADRLGRYLDRATTVLRAYTWKSTVALGETDRFACLPAVIRIATDDAEPFWRKEAVLRLASFRYGVSEADGGILRNPGFEEAADAALSRVAASDPDPSVRRLALWAAAGIAIEGYETRPHRFMDD